MLHFPTVIFIIRHQEISLVQSTTIELLSIIITLIYFWIFKLHQLIKSRYFVFQAPNFNLFIPIVITGDNSEFINVNTIILNLFNQCVDIFIDFDFTFVLFVSFVQTCQVELLTFLWCGIVTFIRQLSDILLDFKKQFIVAISHIMHELNY